MKLNLKFTYDELKNNPTWFKMKKIYDTFAFVRHEQAWGGGQPPDWFMEKYQSMCSRVAKGAKNPTQVDAMFDLLMTASDYMIKATTVVQEMGIPIPKYKIGQVVEFTFPSGQDNAFKEIDGFTVTVKRDKVYVTYVFKSWSGGIPEDRIVGMVKDTEWTREVSLDIDYAQRTPLELKTEEAK